MMNKIQKTLKLETDVPETINEAVTAVRKMGRVGLIADYIGYANHVNVGAVMEKGVALIGMSRKSFESFSELALTWIF